jgi:hypothetical protein
MSLGQEAWEGYLASRFIGYLLPASAATRLGPDEARRFLAGLTSKPHGLDLLRSSAVLAAHADQFGAFAASHLPALLRVLPSRNEVVIRRWEGGFHGRLDLRRTAGERLAASASTFFTSSRRRNHSRPENVLVRALVERIVSEVSNLRQAGVLSEAGWGARFCAHEPGLRRLLGFSRLRDVARERIEQRHVDAARAAPHPCFTEAAALWHRLDDGLRTNDPARLARIIAEGALAPLAPETRFELAVAVRLLEMLEKRLCRDGEWNMHHCVLLPDREEIASFVGPDDLVIRVFHNRSALPAGPAELGARHYLGQQGRMRPDVTVTMERAGRRVKAHVFEVKLSADPGYLLQGLHEAFLYGHEYAAELSGWPKAALVSSSPVVGQPRRDDSIIAVDWDQWVPEAVVDGIVALP